MKVSRKIAAYQERLANALEAGVAPQIHVEWYTSKTWGRCPRVVYPDGTVVCRVGVCGFDKLSTILVDVLRSAPFFTEDTQVAISGASSPGVSRLTHVLSLYGWELVRIVDSASFSAFELRALGEAEG